MTIERLQSVVDEVSELRMRYAASVQKNEECEAQVKEQNEIIKNRFVDKNTDEEALAEEKNSLEKDLQRAQEKNKNLQTKNKSLQAKNKHLKNKIKESLQTKPSTADALSTLQQENNRLSKSLAAAEQNLLRLQKSSRDKQHETRCPDENPFPKLLMREEKQSKE